jgi:hypothetical protein
MRTTAADARKRYGVTAEIKSSPATPALATEQQTELF